MSALPSSDRSETPRNIRTYLWIAARLVLGYALAVATGAIVLTLLLQLSPDFETPHLPHSSTSALELMMICAVLGAIFGLPYATLGSLAFWFLLPRKAPVFLLIGTFCPIGALLTMELILGSATWLYAPMVLLNLPAPIVLFSLPAGLIAAYVYGAVGFGQGLRHWRFA